MNQGNSKKDVGGSNVEIMLTNVAVTSRMKEENEAALTDANIKFPAVYEILKSADMLIADTGASNHTIFCKTGTKNSIPTMNSNQ